MTTTTTTTTTTENRWLAFADSYEPEGKSSRWGATCICFEFTNRKADAGDCEIDPGVAYCADAIQKAESGKGCLGPLFSDDQSYASVRRLLSASTA